MGSIRYPDAFVTCSPIQRGATVLAEPVVIFEVLSKPAARTDRIAKNREYAGTASVRRYVMLEQTAVEGTMFTWEADGNWRGQILGPDTILGLPEIGIDVPLAEFYAGIDLAGASEIDED
jgi:Uma2 family endonuclease